MRLSYRSAREEDFARCFESMCEPHAYPAELRKSTPQLWAQWLREGVMTAHTIEHHRPGGRTEIAGIGGGVFVRDEFIPECRERGQPFVRAELIRRALSGNSAVLTADEMRRAQRASGLTLLFVSDPVAHRGLTESERLLVDAKWGEALYELRGCNIHTLWHEVYGLAAMRRSEGCGQKLCEAWSKRLGRSAGSKNEHEPFLMGLTREEARNRPGTHASFLFMHVPPQFDFTLRQQEMLQQAMRGATDDELASELSVSPSAVKKRWISIYERVSSSMPGWLEGRAENGEARGSEKRRHLLNYLRQHPEELHPACATRE